MSDKYERIKIPWLDRDALGLIADEPKTPAMFRQFDMKAGRILFLMEAACRDEKLEDLAILVDGKVIRNIHVLASEPKMILDTEMTDSPHPTLLSFLRFLDRHRQALIDHILIYGDKPVIDAVVDDGQLKLMTTVETEDIPKVEEGGDRPTWLEYGAILAEAASTRADCTRRKVGAALFGPDNSIITMGYNGGRSGGPSCLKGECPRGRLTHEELPADSAYDTGGGTCIALHAEWNVLIRTSYYQFEGSTLYVTEEPCHICKIMIGGSPIARVVAPGYEWIRQENHILSGLQCEWNIYGPGDTNRRCIKVAGHLDPHE